MTCSIISTSWVWLTPDFFTPKPRRGADQLMAVVNQINQRERAELYALEEYLCSRPGS